MRRLLSLLAPVVLCAAVTATPAAPAHALSCVGPDVVAADAEHLFTGKVIDSADGRVLMDVREVWAGGAVLVRVWLPIDDELRMWFPWADQNGDVPDGFSSEQTWVIATGDDFTVGPCSLWPVSQVRDLRPQHPTAPVQPTSMPLDPPPPARADTPTDDSGPDSGTGLVAAGAGSAAGAGVFGGLWLLRRRRHNPDPAARRSRAGRAGYARAVRLSCSVTASGERGSLSAPRLPVEAHHRRVACGCRDECGGAVSSLFGLIRAE